MEYKENINTKSKINFVLTEAHQQLGQLNDPFYIIGSSALFLSGVKNIDVSDIDILTSNRDAEYLKDAWSERRNPNPKTKDNELFRSNFSQYHFSNFDIEIMGELKVRKEKKWIPLELNELNCVSMDFLTIKIPTLKEQLRILQWFGRDKDLEKMSLITNHLNKIKKQK